MSFHDYVKRSIVAPLDLRSDQFDRPGLGAVHTGHARYSLFLMCRHAALHDMLHAYRIEESALGTHWPEERDR